jgi:ribonuclease Y
MVGAEEPTVTSDSSLILLYILIPFLALGAGLGLALLLPKRAPSQRDDLLVDARAARDERLRSARAQALEERAEAEAAARHALSTLEEVESRLARREERLENRLDAATARETALEAREASLTEQAGAVTGIYDEQVRALDQIRALPAEVARSLLTERVAASARELAATRVEPTVTEAEEQCRQARARPSALSVQRTSSDLVGEFALVPVPIPREEVKGRIIGREGRNIKAFESSTGVELVIDDAPDVVTLSGFDPFRREVARMALLDLVEDGRIHPGRIEEAVKRARDTLERRLLDEGLGAAQAAEAGHLNAEVASLLGRLALMRGEGEDALRTAVRRAGLAAGFAQELRADPRVARRAALLLEIARGVGREAGGSTRSIAADVLARSGESPAVVATLKPIGDLFPAVTPEQAAVALARAVVATGLAAREEAPVRRVDVIERAAAMVEGVADALAFQVGTRVSLLIRPAEPVDALGRVLLARAVLDRIEQSLGPRVGMTVAILAAGARRRTGDGIDANGAARLEGGRGQMRARHGRRGE